MPTFSTSSKDHPKESPPYSQRFQFQLSLDGFCTAGLSGYGSFCSWCRGHASDFPGKKGSSVRSRSASRWMNGFCSGWLGLKWDQMISSRAARPWTRLFGPLSRTIWTWGTSGHGRRGDSHGRSVRRTKPISSGASRPRTKLSGVIPRLSRRCSYALFQTSSNWLGQPNNVHLDCPGLEARTVQTCSFLSKRLLFTHHYIYPIPLWIG